jgi:spore coat protein CotF
MSIVNSLFSNKADKEADKILAYNAMAASAAGANAYLNATLQATTPEFRAMLANITSQKVVEHDSITAFMINKGWMNPYDQPAQQLETSKQDSQSVVS